MGNSCMRLGMGASLGRSEDEERVAAEWGRLHRGAGGSVFQSIASDKDLTL